MQVVVTTTGQTQIVITADTPEEASLMQAIPSYSRVLNFNVNACADKSETYATIALGNQTPPTPPAS